MPGDAVLPDFDPLAVAAGTAARVMVAFANSPDGAAATYPLIVVAGARPGPS